MEAAINYFHLQDAAGQQAADLAYWLAQPVQARIDAVEALREQRHRHDCPGQAFADLRMEKVCQIRRLKPPEVK